MLTELEMRANDEARHAHRELVEKLDQLIAEAEKRGFEAGMLAALKAIYSIGYGKNNDVDEGHEQAFCAVEKHLADWKAAARMEQGEDRG